MPMLEISLPKSSLSQERKEQLVNDLTNTLLKWEGAAPGNARAASIAWAYLNELEGGQLAVGGKLLTTSDSPRYKVVATVPQGALDAARKEGLVREVTELVLAAEGTALDETSIGRVWCIINEVTDGNWGGGGRIFRLKDIRNFVLGKQAKEVEVA